MRRPCIESSEIWYRRVRRSFAVMSAVVGRGAQVAGPSSGQTAPAALGAGAMVGAADPPQAAATAMRSSPERGYTRDSERRIRGLNAVVRREMWRGALLGASRPLKSHATWDNLHQRLYHQGDGLKKTPRFEARTAAGDYARLTQPLVRDGDDLRIATWDEALDRAAEGFRRNLEKNGRTATGIFSCSKSTNEVNFLASKFARQVFGNNNVDSCNRT